MNGTLAAVLVASGSWSDWSKKLVFKLRLYSNHKTILKSINLLSTARSVYTNRTVSYHLHQLQKTSVYRNCPIKLGNL